MMKTSTIGLIGSIMLLALFSCKGQEKVALDSVPPTLNENQMREYNYALTEATKQKLFGNYRQAASLYRKCIEVNPASDAAHFQLSGLLMMSRDLEGAKEMNRKAILLNPDNYWYRLQLGQLNIIGGERENAIEVYEGIVEKWPAKLDTKFELARLYSEDGSYAKALKILNEIEMENGISEPVTMLKEQIYVQQEKPELAEKELLKLINLVPEEIRYLGMLAELYTDIGKNDKALETYERIFEIEPENGIAQVSVAEFYSINEDPVNQFVYLEKAMANPSLDIDRKMMVMIDLLTQEKVFSEHQSEISILLKVLENQYPDDYRVLTAKADYLAKNENYKEALLLYYQVLKEQKENYYIWEQTVFIENLLGKPEAVYERCSEAMVQFKDKPLLYLFKGNAASQLNKHKESIEILEEGLKYVMNNIPLTVQFYSFLAEAWREEGNFDRSDEYFEQAILMEPENLMILNNYSYYLSLRGEKLKDAEKMSRKTIITDPENPTYLDTYAWVLFKSGEYEKARQYLERAVNSGGRDNPDILEHYGDVLNALGRNDEAKKYWEEALKKGGNAEEIEKKIKQ